MVFILMTYDIADCIRIVIGPEHRQNPGRTNLRLFDMVQQSLIVFKMVVLEVQVDYTTLYSVSSVAHSYTTAVCIHMWSFTSSHLYICQQCV